MHITATIPSPITQQHSLLSHYPLRTPQSITPPQQYVLLSHYPLRSPQSITRPNSMACVLIIPFRLPSRCLPSLILYRKHLILSEN
ncbi:MAG: hypothetical protein LBQ31_04615 [Bacteroidales bacterium]|nr:hypothetical protein [Bacteroidales bacterium]